MNCYVIGISSPSGGGKTTLVRNLAQRVVHAVALYFDDYDEVATGANLHPHNLQQWLLDGADYNAWQMPGLIHDLAQLKRGQAIQSPTDGKLIAPQSVAFVDMPFGYANAQLRSYLDYAVYIDTPLDVALARRIQRDYAQQIQPNAEVARQQIQAMVTAYLTWARQAYVEQDRQVKPDCDLVLDGCLTVDGLAECILTAVDLATIDKRNRATVARAR